MPQLDASTFVGQVFWLLIFFGLILLLSAKFTLPKLDKKLLVRAEIIDTAQHQALKLQQSIDNMVKDHTHKLAEAQKNSQFLITKAVVDINKKQAQQKQVFKTEIKQRLSEFEAKMVDQQSILSADITEMATVLTTRIMEYLTQQTVIDQDMKTQTQEQPHD